MSPSTYFTPVARRPGESAMRRSSIAFEFVDAIPERVQEGILYVSTRHRVAVHACCCGCQSEIITPISPVKWSLTFDGKSISLSPSIGNWGIPCESHYWIDKGLVRWAERWSQEEIQQGRAYTATQQEKYYSRAEPAQPAQPAVDAGLPVAGSNSRPSLWLRALRRLWPL